MARNTHPFGDAFHIGYEPASAFTLGNSIGPFNSGTTVQEFLDAINVIVSSSLEPSFTGNAVIRRTISGIAAWTWVRRMTTSGGAQLQAVATYGGTWVAVGEADDGGAAMYYTTNPEGTWTRSTGWPFLSMYGIATDGTTWAVIGNGKLSFTGPGSYDTSTAGRIFTTDRPLEPHHWTQRATNAAEFGQTQPGFSGIQYANSRWVAWGNGGNNPVLFTATSATGTWTEQDTSPFDHPAILDIYYGNSTWVALSGSSSGLQVLTASDPAGTWTNLGNVGPAVDAPILRYGGGYWVVGGFPGPWVATSPSGPWTQMSTGMAYGLALLYDGSRWVYVGQTSGGASRVVVATDPTGTWTSVGIPTTPNIGQFSSGRSIAFDGRVYAVVGTDSFFNDSIIDTALGFAYTAFLADAYIARKLTANAVLKRVQASSLTANAVIEL